MSTKLGTAADYLALLDVIDDYLVATGHAWGKTFTGTGGGDLTAYLGTATSVAETWTLTAINSTTFTVSGSTSGAQANATVGTPYSIARIAFTIVAAGAAFIAGDQFKISTSPPWVRLRGEGCADQSKRSSDFTGFEALFDTSATAVSRVASTGFVEFEMHRASEVLSFQIQCDDKNKAPKDFTLQWKNLVGDSWTTAATFTGIVWANNFETQTFSVTAPGARKFWRLNITGTTDTNPTVELRVLSMRKMYLRAKVGDTYSLCERAEFIWRAPGLDGTKNIYIGLKTYGSAGLDTWNLAFCGFRAYDQTKAVDEQPNGEPGRWLSLINSPMSYWLTVNGQRLITVAKFASLYQTAYAGFGLPYEPPSVHAYPEIIGASGTVRTRRYDSVLADYRHPADPGTDGVIAFYPDAQWRAHGNRQISGGGDPEGSSASNYIVYPARLKCSGDGRPTNFREGLDTANPLLPCVLLASVAGSPGFRHAWGEFDGYYWTTGFGVVAEAIIRESRFDHLVVNNIFRTGTQHYAAIRLD